LSLMKLTEEQFEKLSLLEKSEYTNKMLAEGISQTELSTLLGVSRKQLWRYNKLAEQPYDIRLKISTGDLPLQYLETTLGAAAPVEVQPAVEYLNIQYDPPSGEVGVPPAPITSSSIPITLNCDDFSYFPLLPHQFESTSEKIVPKSTEFDELLQKYKDWLGWVADPKIRDKKTITSRQEVVVINDLHCPHQDNDSLKRMIGETAETADLLVIAGDFLDLFNWSRFAKSSKTLLPVEELRVGQSVLNVLAENYPEVRIMYGNHDARFIRYLQSKGVDGEFLDAMRWMTAAYGQQFSILHAMTHGLENVNLIESPKVDGAEFYFVHQIGDLVLGHPEIYSKIPNKSVGNFIHWLKSFAEPAGVVQPFKVAGIGHTHQAGMTWNDFGVVGFEMGCMEKYPDYVGDPKARTPRPWVQGYTKFVLEDGVVNINESRFFTLK
jgi:UDP-2,3-diacylglucosamine pyrophosphatase LpxH